MIIRKTQNWFKYATVSGVPRTSPDVAMFGYSRIYDLVVDFVNSRWKTEGLKVASMNGDYTYFEYNGKNLVVSLLGKTNPNIIATKSIVIYENGKPLDGDCKIVTDKNHVAINDGTLTAVNGLVTEFMKEAGHRVSDRSKYQLGVGPEQMYVGYR